MLNVNLLLPLFAATVFGGCHRLEPLLAEKRSMWRREMDCLLSVCDYIVELFPSKEIMPDGTVREVRICRCSSMFFKAKALLRVTNPWTHSRLFRLR